jgi:heme oxygenase
MTNILQQILPNHPEVNKLHLAIELKPFLQRYLGKAEGPLTLLDHYRHLRQLKSVYDTFTQLLTSDNFTPKLPDALICLLQRGARIQQDLDFLSPYVASGDKDMELESTKNYVAYLKNLPLRKGDDRNNELLIHFLVSILGDLNGGQFLKRLVTKLYEREGIYKHDAPENGVKFYHFDKDTIANLTSWLKSFIKFNAIHHTHDGDGSQMEMSSSTKSSSVDENAARLGKGAVDAFTMQSAIVDELERTRTPNAVLKPDTRVKAANNSFSFFSCKTLGTIAAAGMMAVATGLVITTTMNRFGS